MKILLVLTSHSEMGNTGHKTGFWLEEFTSPYYIFKDAGAEITLASPKGANRQLTPIVPRRMPLPTAPNDSRRTLKAKRHSRTQKSWPMSTPMITTPSSWPAATARSGIWPRTPPLLP